MAQQPKPTNDDKIAQLAETIVQQLGQTKDGLLSAYAEDLRTELGELSHGSLDELGRKLAVRNVQMAQGVEPGQYVFLLVNDEILPSLDDAADEALSGFEKSKNVIKTLTGSSSPADISPDNLRLFAEIQASFEGLRISGLDYTKAGAEYTDPTAQLLFRVYSDGVCKGMSFYAESAKELAQIDVSALAVVAGKFQELLNLGLIETLSNVVKHINDLEDFSRFRVPK